MGDWLKLYRKILESEVFQDSDPALMKVWIWCLVSANYTTRQFKGLAIVRGQFVTGRRKGAAAVGLDESKWYRCMKRLEDMGSISQKPNSEFTVVTVCNFEAYQNAADDSEQQVNNDANSNPNSQPTANEQPAEQQVNTSKEGKKEESKKEELGGCEPPKTKARKPKDVFDPMKMVPPELDSPEFREAWASWVAHRAEIRKPLTPTAAKMNIQKCLAIGIDRALAAFSHSIGAGWQGLFEETAAKGQTNGHRNGTGAADPRGNFAAREEFLARGRGGNGE